MRKLIVRKSGRTLKNIEKTPVILNSKFNTNSSKKHDRNEIIIQFKHSFKSHVSDESEVTSEDEKSSKSVKDISLEIYIFYKFVMLNNIMIIDDMDFLKYKEFDYH